jgi:hypothetical protein
MAPERDALGVDPGKAHSKSFRGQEDYLGAERPLGGLVPLEDRLARGAREEEVAVLVEGDLRRVALHRDALRKLRMNSVPNCDISALIRFENWWRIELLKGRSPSAHRSNPAR